MQYHDAEFIECAYLTLLQRPVDPAGLEFHLGRLRTGTPKLKILAQLHASAESRLDQVELPGIRRAVRLYKVEQIPLIGTVLAFFLMADGSWVFENQLRGFFKPMSVQVSAESMLEELPPRAREIYRQLREAEVRQSVGS